MTSGCLRNSGSVRLSLSLQLSVLIFADCAVCSDRAPLPKKAIMTTTKRDARRELLKAKERKNRLRAQLYGSVGDSRAQIRWHIKPQLKLTWLSPAVLATFLFATCAGAYLIFSTPITGPFGVHVSAAKTGPTVTIDHAETTSVVDELSSIEATNPASTFSSAVTAVSTSSETSALTDTTRASRTATPTGSPKSTDADGGKAFDASALKAMGISTLLGNNTGAIASWYRADDPRDSTNGVSVAINRISSRSEH